MVDAMLGKIPSRMVAASDPSDPYEWSLQPLVLLAIAIVGGAYAWRRHQLTSSGSPPGSRDNLRALSFAAGLVILALATMSPIDSLGEQRLFSVHMAQHLLLADIAPILLLLGLSRQLLRPLVRRTRPLEEALGTLAHPLTALIVLVAVVWAWHVEVLYEAALNHPWVHELEHLMFFTAGIGFWWYVIEPVPPRHRLRGMWTGAYVTGAKFLLGGLGLMLAFSPDAIYDFYVDAPRTWGLSAVEDQNVGGLLMMLEQSTVLLIFFGIMISRMLDQAEKTEQQRERFGLPDV
jgi:putative membrane protein